MTLTILRAKNKQSSGIASELCLFPTSRLFCSGLVGLGSSGKDDYQENEKNKDKCSGLHSTITSAHRNHPRFDIVICLSPW